MRNHKPIIHRLAKERDYLCFEYRALQDLEESFKSLQPILETNVQLKPINAKLVDFFKTFDFKKITEAQDDVRKLIFVHKFKDDLCFLLMFCNFLSNFNVLISKNPESYDESIRPKGWLK